MPLCENTCSHGPHPGLYPDPWQGNRRNGEFPRRSHYESSGPVPAPEHCTAYVTIRPAGRQRPVTNIAPEAGRPGSGRRRRRRPVLSHRRRPVLHVRRRSGRPFSYPRSPRKEPASARPRRSRVTCRRRYRGGPAGRRSASRIIVSGQRVVRGRRQWRCSAVSIFRVASTPRSGCRRTRQAGCSPAADYGSTAATDSVRPGDGVPLCRHHRDAGRAFEMGLLERGKSRRTTGWTCSNTRARHRREERMLAIQATKTAVCEGLKLTCARPTERGRASPGGVSFTEDAKEGRGLLCREAGTAGADGDRPPPALHHRR